MVPCVMHLIILKSSRRRRRRRSLLRIVRARGAIPNEIGPTPEEEGRRRGEEECVEEKERICYKIPERCGRLVGGGAERDRVDIETVRLLLLY